MTRVSGEGPFGSEHVSKFPPKTNATPWWHAYEMVLTASGFSERSREVLSSDAEFIVDQAFPEGPSSSGGELVGRVRRGLVMGAVQSGKTASMLAVTAKALDAGVDAVIILAGTRTALWSQTFDRVIEQLDALEDRTRRRILLPDRSRQVAGGAASLSTMYSVTPQLARRSLERGRPLLAVVMKHVAHLEQLSATLDVIYAQASEVGARLRVLVIDDEADDSSVMDDDDFPPLDADALQRKQVPLRILDLWAPRNESSDLKLPELSVTYLAYTATPQANFLQDPANPLAPRDFVTSLRTAGATGDWEIRSSSYRDPAGPHSWYTGGDMYYRLMDPVPICVPVPNPTDEDALKHALRGYLVACAIRLVREGITDLSDRESTSYPSASDAAVPPMSMLIHPSATKDEHFRVAERLLRWTYGPECRSDSWQGDEAGRRLGVQGLLTDLSSNEKDWLHWIEGYRRSAALAARVMQIEAKWTPSLDDWGHIRGLLTQEVIPATRVAVINSDDEADDRPNFAAWHDGNGWRIPRNTSTVFVSGNVMSRGLTLEGLTTTVFARTSGVDLADSQMQMQRWFGYRAKIIDLCRVFATEGQLENFRHYHENDEALRRDVLAAMEREDVPDIRILQGRGFRATGKISSIRGVAISPGHRPFVRHLTPPTLDDSNLRMIAGLFPQSSITVAGASGSKGLVSGDSLDLAATAAILDQLVYSDHGPGPGSAEASRWASVANHVGLAQSDPLMPLYRAPYVADGLELGSASPYAIAAYLRLWAACLDRRVPGMMTSDLPPVPWSLIDLDVRRSLQPRFRLGLRFGEGPTITDGPLAHLTVPVRSMARAVTNGALDATWGARGIGPNGILGDEFFDYEAHGDPVTLAPSGARPLGSEGLVLFHVVARPGNNVSIAVGLSIPAGGPDHVQAQRQEAPEVIVT